jgi:hypothetical protein
VVSEAAAADEDVWVLWIVVTLTRNGDIAEANALVEIGITTPLHVCKSCIAWLMRES